MLETIAGPFGESFYFSSSATESTLRSFFSNSRYSKSSANFRKLAGFLERLLIVRLQDFVALQFRIRHANLFWEILAPWVAFAEQEFAPASPARQP